MFFPKSLEVLVAHSHITNARKDRNTDLIDKIPGVQHESQELLERGIVVEAPADAVDEGDVRSDGRQLGVKLRLGQHGLQPKPVGRKLQKLQEELLGVAQLVVVAIIVLKDVDLTQAVVSKRRGSTGGRMLKPTQYRLKNTFFCSWLS